MVLNVLCLFVYWHINTVASSYNYGRVKDIPGYNNSHVSYSGYIDVPSSSNSSIYFWFYESFATKSKPLNEIPIILWLQGGPGSSSSMGNFFQFIGPYSISQPMDVNEEIKLIPTNISWVENFHILFIDQPIGVGLSPVAKDTDYIIFLQQGARHLYEILEIFFAEMFPEYQSNEFYIAGEGYTAKYAPIYAQYILQKQHTNNSSVPAVTGIMVGNGWNYPCFQLPYIVSQAQMLGIITKQEANDLNNAVNNEFIPACDRNDYSQAFIIFTPIIEYILSVSANMDEYDSRYHCMLQTEYDYTWIQQFLNNDTIRELLFVNYTNEWKFVMNSDQVLIGLFNENMIDSTPYYVSLLDEYKIRILLYQGQNDPLWTIQAQFEWLDKMKWNGQNVWVSSRQKPWKGNGNIPVGYVRYANNLTFVQVFNAGHSTHMDQPQTALQMITNFIYRQPF
eukprot:13205_1